MMRSENKCIFLLEGKKAGGVRDARPTELSPPLWSRACRGTTAPQRQTVLLLEKGSGRETASGGIQSVCGRFLIVFPKLFWGDQSHPAGAHD